MTPPPSPFAPVSMLFLSASDSDLLAFLTEAHALIVDSPALLTDVEADLDAHGLRKKALRVADAAWTRGHTSILPGCSTDSAPPPAQGLTLAHGRPRTPAYVALIALMLRGYLGTGFKACDATTLMQESMTLRVFFANQGLKMPGRSTLTELVNAVTNKTRSKLLDAQVARVLKLGWDDFSVLLQDSTHVEGNTAWPTDSRLLVDLVARMLRVGAALPRLELPAIDAPTAARHFAVMAQIEREIALAGGRDRERARKKRYRALLWRAHRVHDALTEAITPVNAALAALDVLPSRKAMATRAVNGLCADHKALAQVMSTCEARILRDEKVPMAAKKLSLSDPDVGFIAKGQRVPVIGYKPQIARSGAGFITGLLLPQGNAADSNQLVPMVDEVTRRTGVLPGVVSVDDGYASQANVAALQERGVEVISINGAKGRALTADSAWDSDEYAAARDHRSGIESLMFTLKQGFDFGEVARRGLAQVHGELLEKAIAYNLCHMVRTRQRLDRERREAREQAA